jgi:hypothetical protein
VLGTMAAGQSSVAYCYSLGETISDFGITNDVWVW